MNKNSVEDLKPQTQKLYGFYRGVVEDINDSLKVGRVRVRIFGLHTSKLEKDEFEGIPTSELPWAEPCLGLLEGSISGYGFFNVPLKGSHVMVFFENGYLSQPRYFATMPGIPASAPDTSIGFNDPDGVYPDKVGESDFNRLSRGISTDTIVDTRNGLKETGISKAGGGTWDEPASAYNAEYPHNIVLSTHGGSVIEIDSTPDNERLNIYHKTNTFIEIDKSGNVVIKNSKSKYEIVAEDKNIYIKQDENKTIAGNKTKKVTSNETDDIGGNKTDTVGGNLSISVTGNITLTSPSTIITGGTVSLSSQGTLKKLMNEEMIDAYNTHKHGGSDPPDNQLSTGSHATSNTTAS